MAEEKKVRSRLKTPHGVGPQGPVEDLAQAALQATAALPEILAIKERDPETGQMGYITITQVLDDIAASLSVIVTYLQRKGKEEGIFGPEDITDQEGSDHPDDPDD